MSDPQPRYHIGGYVVYNGRIGIIEAVHYHAGFTRGEHYYDVRDRRGYWIRNADPRYSNLWERDLQPYPVLNTRLVGITFE